LLLAACGGGSVPLDSLGTELAKLSCSKIFECCNATEQMQQFNGITYNGQPITTEAQCEGFYAGFFNGLALGDFKASLAAGRIGYDGEAAQSCIDAAANLGCSAYSMARDQELVCDKPFLVAKVADGGACTQNYECTSGNCEDATVDPNGTNTDGMCKPMPTAGQDCTSRCAQGLYCGYDQTAMKETCQAVKPNGTACTGDNECTSGHCISSTCGDPAPVCDGM
jgi:hypothetical protein